MLTGTTAGMFVATVVHAPVIRFVARSRRYTRWDTLAHRTIQPPAETGDCAACAIMCRLEPKSAGSVPVVCSSRSGSPSPSLSCAVPALNLVRKNPVPALFVWPSNAPAVNPQTYTLPSASGATSLAWSHDALPQIRSHQRVPSGPNLLTQASNM